MRTSSVFVVLREILFAFKPFDKFLRSLFTCLLMEFTKLLKFRRLVHQQRGVPQNI